MLTGQAKTDYQREYMRRRRSNAKAGSNVVLEPKSVRPVTPKSVRPKQLEIEDCASCDMPMTCDASQKVGLGTRCKPKQLTAQEIIAKIAKTQIEKKYGSVAKAITEVCKPEPQSHSPMMVGYVPPKT